jgi:chemotaxis protein histidine kinase CheA
MQDALRALIENYCTTLARQMNEIAGHIGHMEDCADTMASLRSALDLVHQISGLSGTMGYAEIGGAAIQLETFMRRFEDGSARPSAEDCAAIAKLFEELARHAGGAAPEHSTLYHADLSALTGGR